MEKLKKAICFLQCCGISKKNILICGTYALKFQGIDVGREPHDVDVCVKYSDTLESFFQGVCDAQGNNFYKQKENSYNVSGCKHKPFIFKIFDNIEINVWLVDEIDSCLRYSNEDNDELRGCYIQPVGKVLAAKKSYNREKDWKDIGNIVGNIISNYPVFKV